MDFGYCLMDVVSWSFKNLIVFGMSCLPIFLICSNSSLEPSEMLKKIPSTNKVGEY